MSTFKFKCWEPNNTKEDEAVEIEAEYGSDAAEQFFHSHILGFDSPSEYEDKLISVRDPFGRVEQFEIELDWEPVYQVVRIDD